MGADQREPAAVPVVRSALTPAQNIVWNVAGAIEIIVIFGIVEERADMNDPVVIAITSVCAILVIWVTRKVIVSQAAAEAARRLRNRFRR